MASNTKPKFTRQNHLPVLSAIPSTTLTLSSLPSRPAVTNQSKKIQKLYTNHFPCDFGNNIRLYQYDVSIESIGTKSDEWYEMKSRSRCSEIMQTIISTGKFGSDIVVWYDEQRCLYSTTCLLTLPMIIHAEKNTRLNIKSLANYWSTSDIHDYINGRANTYPYDAVRILETLLKRSIQDHVKIINNICYFKNEQPKTLTAGFIERTGFSQALVLSSKRMTLNIQTKLTTFYPEMNLIDFIHQQIGAQRIPTLNDLSKLNRTLKGCHIVTQQSQWRDEYEFSKFDNRRPSEIKIESGETLIQYYQNEKNITLVQTSYPCIEVYHPHDYRSPCHLPLDVCRIKGWQVYDKQLSKALQTNQPRKEIPRPAERYQAIMEVLQKCYAKASSNILCKEVGFWIDSNKMLELDARVLAQPEVFTGLNSTADIRIGRIALNGHLFTPRPISNLSITYFGTRFQLNETYIKQFSHTLLHVMRKYHVDAQYRLENVQPVNDRIENYFSNKKDQACEFIICIMDAPNAYISQLKADIKSCGTIKYGIMTQCVLFSKIYDNRSITCYCENLIRKINCKNSGINTQVNLDIALKDKNSENDSFMFFGADVIHPTNVTRQHPSIAAVVGSGDSLCSVTATRVCQQFPREGKCSIETIVAMTEMVKQLLEYYQLGNDVLPNKIVFYRDGVDDGQFGKILAYEIPAIREAFNNVYGNESNHPLLTFIVVKKRHNTRFFTYDVRSGQTNNVPIGTIIDTTITHPYQNNFYLNSHNAFHGVNHPPLYHVLLDEIGFTADELHLLTFHLCFADPRSAYSEAIPSIVHQADIAALKARDLFYNDDRSSTSSIGGRIRPLENPTLNDITYEILDVHEELQNLPVFA